MNKIDIDKFVASLIEFSPQQSMKYIKALENQGLKYKDGKIVEIEQESEDEKIRKELINRINGLWENDAAMWPSTLEEKNKYIAWLEKQGKHKDYYTKQELIDMGFSFTLNGDIVTPDKMMEDMKKYLAWKEKQAPKPKWSEEDETIELLAKDM